MSTPAAAMDRPIFSKFNERQKEIAFHLMLGKYPPIIAKELHCSKHCIYQNLTQMYLLAGITRGVKLVRLAVILTYESKPHLRVNN